MGLVVAVSRLHIRQGPMAISHLPAPGATALEHASTGDTQAAALETRNVVAHSSLIVPLFASTMFLSGFLLFLVEPMAAKMVLPILGGVPMVWNGCVVFFQIVMLAGYGYAFGASRWLQLRHHVVLHAAVLAAPAAVLPFMIQAGSVTPPDGNPLGVAAAAAGRQHRAALLRAVDERVGVPALAVAHRPSLGPRSVLPLFGEQPRVPARARVVSDRRRAAVHAARADAPLDDRLRRVRPAGRRLRGLRMAANRQRRSSRRRPRRTRPRHGRERRSRRCAARAGWRCRSFRRASCSPSRAMCRPTSRRFRCCGSCRSRCTSSPSRWPSAGTRPRSGRWRGGRFRCSSCRSRCS